ncbi:MAG: hypothetical protein ACLUVG_12795 [Phocaeicola vulgatus]
MERKQISIGRHTLGKLEWAKGTYPTPLGRDRSQPREESRW